MHHGIVRGSNFPSTFFNSYGPLFLTAAKWVCARRTAPGSGL